MEKAIRKYDSFSAIKDDELQEWQALPAHVRLNAMWELSVIQYGWKNGEVVPALDRTLVRLRRT
jgi:hypothetical protein